MGDENACFDNCSVHFRKKLQVESYIEPRSRAVVLVVEEPISVSPF